VNVDVMAIMGAAAVSGIMSSLSMADFVDLLRSNRNYRCTWMGQVVSEIGDYFNNIAVFSLVMQTSGSGLVVSGVMLARAIPAVVAGPIAGVTLDRFDRKRIMIASDLIRAVVAITFIATIHQPKPWLLYLLSGVLMFASPFFTSGRAAILPTIANPRELHAANSLTQTTQWATLTAGTMLAGWSADRLGYTWAFVINSLSFLFSAAAIWLIDERGVSFRAQRQKGEASHTVRPWHEYREGLEYIRSTPLILGIGLLSVGWAAGGGAAQILFTLFGEQIFKRGAAGIGEIWGLAGVGLLIGGGLAHLLGRRISFNGYKKTVTISYLSHGLAYVAFSLAAQYWLALVMICLSRVGMAVCSVLNYSQLLRHTPDEFRGRVFATMESLRWGTMIVSMAAAGICSQYWSARSIGVVAGIFGTVTAAGWLWADQRGKLQEPQEVRDPVRDQAG
jgi:MFS family permease